MPRKSNKKQNLIEAQKRYWLFFEVFRKPFCQICDTLFFHPEFIKLSLATRIVYIAMCLQSGGEAEFFFPRLRMSKALGMSPATITNAVEELKANKFIEVAENWSHIKGKATKYRFVSGWKSRVSTDYCREWFEWLRSGKGMPP